MSKQALEPSGLCAHKLEEACLSGLPGIGTFPSCSGFSLPSSSPPYPISITRIASALWEPLATLEHELKNRMEALSLNMGIPHDET